MGSGEKRRGTCPYCGRSGFVVDRWGRVSKHGYRIHWGNQKGDCPGSRLWAAEVAPRRTLAHIAAYQTDYAEFWVRVRKPGFVAECWVVANYATRRLDSYPGLLNADGSLRVA